MKKILLTIICFFCVLGINNAVLASEATCVYVDQDVNPGQYYTITIKDDKLSIDYSLKQNFAGNKIVVTAEGIHIGHFIENNKYFCRGKLYYYMISHMDNSFQISVNVSNEKTTGEMILDKTRSKVINDDVVVHPDVPDDEVIMPDNSQNSENNNSAGNNQNGFFGNLEVVKCGDTEIPAPLPPITRAIVTLIKIIAPLVLIIMGMIDIVQAVTASDEKKIKEAQNKFIKRLLPAVLIFLVVTIVQLLVGIVADNATESDALSKCIDCMISDESKCGTN